MKSTTPMAAPPAHDPVSRTTRTIEGACMLLAAVLLLANVVRLVRTGVTSHWWAPVAAFAAALAGNPL